MSISGSSRTEGRLIGKQLFCVEFQSDGFFQLAICDNIRISHISTYHLTSQLFLYACNILRIGEAWQVIFLINMIFVLNKKKICEKILLTLNREKTLHYCHMTPFLIYSIRARTGKLQVDMERSTSMGLCLMIVSLVIATIALVLSVVVLARPNVLTR